MKKTTSSLNENHWKTDKSIPSDKILSKVKALLGIAELTPKRLWRETVRHDCLFGKDSPALAQGIWLEIGEENPWTAPLVRMEKNPLTIQRRLWALFALSSSVYKARGSFCMLSIEGHQKWQSR